MTRPTTQRSEGASKLGRFGHHPDPAIDFCVEVEELASITENKRLGLSDPKHLADRVGLSYRIARAMTFRAGGDAGAVEAKAQLREIEVLALATGKEIDQ